MNVVLDTNVLVSAALTEGGTCARVVDRIIDGTHPLFVDDRILEEYRRVLPSVGLPLYRDRARELLDFIELVAVPLDPLLLDAELPHEGDRPFLEVAAATGAVLVTGNKRHFPKRVCKSVRVLAPAEFLDLLRRPL